MSVSTNVHALSLSTAGFEDGLGRRSIRFDREVGGILECLHLRPELRAFELVLKGTSTRITALGDERFARTFGYERDSHGLVVLSELPSGERLSDLIDAQRSDEAGVSAIDAAVGLLLQVMPALAKLHDADLSHGTLTPGRIIVTPTAQVVLLDTVYGAAVERLAFTRHTLWTTFGLVSAPSAGPVRLDARADIAQAALSAAALALGRTFSPAAPPDLHQLVGELSDVAHLRSGDRFAESIRGFFQTALPRSGQSPLSADALCADVRRLADFIGVDTALGTLAELVRSAPAIERSIGNEFEQDEEETFDTPISGPPARAVDVRIPEPRRESNHEPPPSPPVEPRHEPAASEISLPAEFLPTSAPVLIQPPTPQELAGPESPSVPPLVAPAAQETFEIAASLPALPSPNPTSWVPAATLAPSSIGAVGVPPPPPPAPTPAPSSSPPWATATPIAPSTVPTVFAAPMAPLSPVALPPPAPYAPPAAASVPPPAPFVPAPPPPLPPLQPPPVLVAPPAAVAAPAPVQLQPPQKLKIKSEGPSGYTPVRSPGASMPRAPEFGGQAASVPFLDRLAAEDQSRGFSWRMVAGIALALLVTGGFLGRDYILGRIETAPPATEPVAATKPVAAPTVGVLDVKSLPAGARVVLDGDEVGVTPLVLESVSPGRHTVVVSTETASVRRTVRIEAGKTVSLDLSVFAGWVAVFSPIPLHVSEDGRALGTTDSGRILLPPGRHMLTLTNTEYGYSTQQPVDIVAGEERALNVTPKGTVNVNAQPWAEVWVDGQRVGETPIANLEVALGAREFVFKHPQYGERKTVTTVTSKPAAVSVDFTRQY